MTIATPIINDDSPRSGKSVVSVVLIDPSSFNRSCILAGLGMHEDLSISGYGDIPDDRRLAMADIIIISGDPLDKQGIALPLQLEHLQNQCPDIPIAVMVATNSAPDMAEMLKLRVSGLVTNDISPERMNYLIRLLVAGFAVYPGNFPEMLAELKAPEPAKHLPKPVNGAFDEKESAISHILTDHQFDPLTPRQRDVLRYLSLGHANKVIARKLSISESTVKVHIRAIMEHVGVSNRTQIVAHFLALSSQEHGHGHDAPNMAPGDTGA